MPDYGRDLKFGWFAEPNVAQHRELISAARVADRNGLDLIGIQDHAYNPDHLENWTLLSAIALATERLHVFPDVANLPLRPPVMLAKAAATLDVLTDGRVEIGLGAGAFPQGIAAMDGPRRETKPTVREVEESIDVMREFWSGKRSVRYRGKYHSLDGTHPGPPPAHDIGIWLGVLGPRMLELLGRKGDGWLPSLSFVPPEKLLAAHDLIDAGASDAGRDPAQIERIYNVWGSYSTEQWIELLTGITLEFGMNGYVFGVPPVESELRRITDEVAPAVREAVTAERARRDA